MKKKELKKIAYSEYGKNQATSKTIEAIFAFIIGFGLEWLRIELDIAHQITGVFFGIGILVCFIYLLIGRSYKNFEPEKDEYEKRNNR